MEGGPEATTVLSCLSGDPFPQGPHSTQHIRKWAAVGRVTASPAGQLPSPDSRAAAGVRVSGERRLLFMDKVYSHVPKPEVRPPAQLIPPPVSRVGRWRGDLMRSAVSTLPEKSSLAPMQSYMGEPTFHHEEGGSPRAGQSGGLEEVRTPLPREPQTQLCRKLDKRDSSSLGLMCVCTCFFFIYAQATLTLSPEGVPANPGMKQQAPCRGVPVRRGEPT